MRLALQMFEFWVRKSLIVRASHTQMQILKIQLLHVTSWKNDIIKFLPFSAANASFSIATTANRRSETKIAKMCCGFASDFNYNRENFTIPSLGNAWESLDSHGKKP